jgi:hypothetical protein
VFPEEVFAARIRSEKAFIILHALLRGLWFRFIFFETKEIKILADIGGERQADMRFERKRLQVR